MAKKKSYHFNVGNSATGSVGFCARVLATSKKEAVQILNEAMESCSEGHTVYDDKESGDPPAEGLEYLNVYFGQVTAADIDEVDDDP